ncbi:MAG: c-type cytochrome [Pseudomonadota bacterium]
MGELGLNKLFGALLAVGLAVLGLKELSTIVFGGGHHGPGHEYESLNTWAESNFAYRVDIAETGGSGEVIEEIYDLGLLLASADIARGERSFRGKCSTCHTVEQGGANGTGPNLYGIMGTGKGVRADFAAYSGALANTEGNWSYENMDNWLLAPARYARGTNMAFAGLSRDDERANVLAYLASYSPDGPAAPEPLPAVEEAVVEEAEGDLAVTDASITDAEAAMVEAPAPAEAVVEEATEAVAAAETSVIETVAETAEDAAESVTEASEELVDDAVEDVTETVEEAVEATEDLVETPETPAGED